MIIPIDFQAISKETGVRKGKIFYSNMARSFVVSGHPDIDMICIDPPYKKGDIVDGVPVKRVLIRKNNWCLTF